MTKPRSPSPLWHIITLYVPACLINLADWLRPLLFNIFVSRNVKASSLSHDEAALELDAVGLAVMSLNLLMFATAFGFNGAIDAYASVAFGAGNRIELNAILARQLVLLCVLGLLASLMFANAETCFALLGLRPELGARTASLLTFMSLAVPGDFLYDALGRWMRAQQLHRLVARCSLAALVLNLALNVWLADSDAPTRAPLIALIAQNSVLPVLLGVTYSRHMAGVAPAEEEARAPLVAPARQVLGPALWRQLGTGLAAMLWTCAELWAWEAQVFEASALGVGNSAAYTLLSSTYSLLIQLFPVGVSQAASALVGEALGRDDVPRATRLLGSACLLSTCLVCAYAVPLAWFRHSLASLLGGGVPAVELKVARVLPLVLATHVADGTFNQLKAWLTVRQKQAFGALMSLVVYYGVGLPLGFVLAFERGWGLYGLWTGLSVAVLAGCVTAGGQAWLDIRDMSRLGDAEVDAASDLSDLEDEDDAEANGDGMATGVYEAFVDGTPSILQAMGGRAAEAGGKGPPAGRSWCASPARNRAWASRVTRSAPVVSTVLGVLALGGSLAWDAPWRGDGGEPETYSWSGPATRTTIAAQLKKAPSLLQGAAPCVWSTGGGFYEYPFTAYWDASRRSYGWEVLIANRSQAVVGTDAGRRLGTFSSAASLPAADGSTLRLGRAHDVYDAVYAATIDPVLEVGWATWLVPPRVTLADDGTWTSVAFVGTRVSTARHTFCGCQMMTGGPDAFTLTEHGRAQLEDLPSAHWYVNMTRAQINEGIARTCAPFVISAKYDRARACPADNATAMAEWRELGAAAGWVVPPWVEVYSSLPR